MPILVDSGIDGWESAAISGGAAILGAGITLGGNVLAGQERTKAMKAQFEHERRMLDKQLQAQRDMVAVAALSSSAGPLPSFSMRDPKTLIMLGGGALLLFMLMGRRR